MSERDEITAAALHELREPVQAIRGFLAIVLAERTGPLNHLQHDFLSSANRAATRLERLIRDIDVVGSGDGSLTLIPEELHLPDSVEACVAELQPMASDLGVEVSVDVRSPDRVVVMADSMRMDQILVNLLENAMRYGVLGAPIHILLRGGPRRVLCIVENEIPVDMRDQDPKEWFQPFTRQSQNHDWAGVNGKGLGLSVVKRLVEAHHGRVLACVDADRARVGFVLPRDVYSPLIPQRLIRVGADEFS